MQCSAEREGNALRSLPKNPAGLRLSRHNAVEKHHICKEQRGAAMASLALIISFIMATTLESLSRLASEHH
jgi:hypothetical protein